MSKNNVDHPQHYNSGKFEVIDVIEDWNLGFNLGNTVKYIGRAGKKDPAKLVEDLKKARWYLDREIARLEKDQVQTKIEEVVSVRLEGGVFNPKIGAFDMKPIFTIQDGKLVTGDTEYGG